MLSAAYVESRAMTLTVLDPVSGKLVTIEVPAPKPR